jgi:hypothetical protein
MSKKEKEEHKKKKKKENNTTYSQSFLTEVENLKRQYTQKIKNKKIAKKLKEIKQKIEMEKENENENINIIDDVFIPPSLLQNNILPPTISPSSSSSSSSSLSPSSKNISHEIRTKQLPPLPETNINTSFLLPDIKTKTKNRKRINNLENDNLYIDFIEEKEEEDLINGDPFKYINNSENIVDLSKTNLNEYKKLIKKRKLKRERKQQLKLAKEFEAEVDIKREKEIELLKNFYKLTDDVNNATDQYKKSEEELKQIKIDAKLKEEKYNKDLQQREINYNHEFGKQLLKTQNAINEKEAILKENQQMLSFINNEEIKIKILEENLKKKEEDFQNLKNQGSIYVQNYEIIKKN